MIESILVLIILNVCVNRISMFFTLKMICFILVILHSQNLHQHKSLMYLTLQRKLNREQNSLYDAISPYFDQIFFDRFYSLLLFDSIIYYFSILGFVINRKRKVQCFYFLILSIIQRTRLFCFQLICGIIDFDDKYVSNEKKLCQT